MLLVHDVPAKHMSWQWARTLKFVVQFREPRIILVAKSVCGHHEGPFIAPIVGCAGAWFVAKCKLRCLEYPSVRLRLRFPDQPTHVPSCIRKLWQQHGTRAAQVDRVCKRNLCKRPVARPQSRTVNGDVF